MNTKATALLAIGALGLAACGSSSNSASTGASSASNAASTSQSAAASGGGYGSGASKSSTTKAVSNGASKTIDITMSNYSFGPKTITGKPGSTVKVSLKNVSGSEHNFKIDGQKAADADVPPGKSGTALVKIPTSGSVQFYCEYHKGLGMVGTVKPS